MKLHQTAVCLLTIGWSIGAFAIINGRPLPDGDYAEAVHIKSSVGEDCVGVLVGPQVIATAAHCVRNSDQATVTFSDGSHRRASFTKSSLYPAKNHDLALGLLNKEASIEPAWVATRPLATGQEVTMIGDGCTTPETPIDGVMRIGNAVVEGLDAYNVLVGGGVGRALACYGDSGAPVFAGRDDDERVVGLLTMGNLTTKSYAVRFDTAESTALLKKFTAENEVEICGFRGFCGDRK